MIVFPQLSANQTSKVEPITFKESIQLANFSTLLTAVGNDSLQAVLNHPHRSLWIYCLATAPMMKDLRVTAISMVFGSAWIKFINSISGIQIAISNSASLNLNASVSGMPHQSGD